MTVKTQTKTTSARKTTEPKLKTDSKPEDHPDLLDSFRKSHQAQEKLHLIQEHRAQFSAQEELHQERLRTIREQLQLQLFKMWNEMWLQRQKFRDQSLKEWFKVFLN